MDLTLEKSEKIKYTAVLPKQVVIELKTLVNKQIIPSVNQGIQKAIEAFLVEKKKELYRKLMEEASKDEAFLKRTLENQSAFEKIDSEISES